ncbi:MAG TPA: hypothetical protein VLD39_15525, partial [Gammaproteobacteria bacterium]|nr:hypothetical protein [Gammaproteobacteria bacterium]
MIRTTQLLGALGLAVALLSPLALDAQATTAKPAVRTNAAADSATLVTRGNAAAPSVNIDREVFSYSGGGR